MFHKVDEAFAIAKAHGIVSNKKVFYQWLSQGVLKSEKLGGERYFHHEDLVKTINEKLHPFVKELLEENKRLKEALQQK